MTFRTNPIVSPVIAIVTWLSVLPLGVLIDARTHLVEAAVLVGIVGVLGALGALVNLGRSVIFLVQLFAAGGVLVWRGMALGPDGAGFPDMFALLVRQGANTVATSAPPVPSNNGIVWVILLLVALVQLVLELLVTVLEQPAWGFAPLALAYVIAAIANTEELSLITFAVVAGSYVLLLVVSTGVGEGHRTQQSSRSFSFHTARVVLAVVLALGGVAAAAAIQPLMPMGDKQPWQNPQDGPIQLGDPTVELNENLRRPEDQPMFSYKTSNGEPTYFRTVAMPDLTTDGVRLVPMTLHNYGLANAYNAPGEKLDVEVQMRAVPSEYLPVPFAVEGFSAEGVWSYDPDTLSVVATGAERTQQTVNLNYTATSVVPSPSSEEIDAARAGNDVPDITKVVPQVDQQVVDLTREIVKDAKSDGEKAQLMQDFLRGENFEYSLDAPQTATLDVVSSFLLQDRTGYCIHFAAGMMTMARVEGIPSRMAVGFNSGTKQDDGTYLVTSHNMHAWPELYFEGLGWVPFEPTPSVASPPDYTNGDPDPGEPTPTPSESPSPQPQEPSPLPSLPPETVPPSDKPVDGGGAQGGQLPPWTWPVVISVIVLALLAMAPVAIRTGQARFRLRTSQPPAALAAGAWDEVRATFTDVGRRWPSGSPGPAARTAAKDLDEGELLLDIAQTVERAAFSRDPGDLSQLPQKVAALKKSMYADAPPGAKWWPRSLWDR